MLQNSTKYTDTMSILGDYKRGKLGYAEAALLLGHIVNMPLADARELLQSTKKTINLTGKIVSITVADATTGGSA